MIILKQQYIQVASKCNPQITLIITVSSVITVATNWNLISNTFRSTFAKTAVSMGICP
jgi:hypothetical protein